MSKANNKIEVGDKVRIRWPQALRNPLGLDFTVLGLRSNGNVNNPPYWTLRDNATQQLLILDFYVVLEVLN
jgi:hypothetical protein